MRDNTLAFALPVVGVIVGLAILLYAEWAGLSRTIVVGGGVVVLAAMGILTYVIAALDHPEGHDAESH